MPRYRSYSRSRSPVRRSKHYDDPRDHRRDRRSPAPSGLLVRNISLSARPEDLRTPFERFGPIKDVYLPKNYYSGEPRGFGFVKFRFPEDAAEARSHLNHTVIGGREIRIVFAEENRKAPHEMRRIASVSSRGSRRRWSPSGSPRRRYHSYSRSPSPAHCDSRVHEVVDDDYSTRRSRSVSPRDDRRLERSPRNSRSVSRSLSPRDGKHLRVNHQSSPAGNGQAANAPSNSPSPRKNTKIPSSPR